MNIYIYILELKNRFLLLFLTWISVFLVSYFYKEVLLFVFLELGLFTVYELKVYYFIFTNAIEVFTVYIRLALFFSIQFVFIYFFYHIFIFSIPSLFSKEYFYLKFFLKVTFAIWLFSIFLAKYFFIPLSLDFFFNFQNSKSVNLYFEANIKDYLNFYINFFYVFVCYFQIFGCLLLALNMLSLNVLWVKKSRKVIYFFGMLFSTLVSPPDVFSQITIFIALLILYEVFIFIFLINYFIKNIKINSREN